MEAPTAMDMEMLGNKLRTLRFNNFMNPVCDLVSEMKLLYVFL